MFFAEYRKSIGNAQVVLNGSKILQSSDAARILIKDDVICLELDNNTKVTCPLGFQINADTEDVRPNVDQLDDGSVKVSYRRQSVSDTMPSGPDPCVRTSLRSWLTTNANVPYTIKCTFCKNAVSSDCAIMRHSFSLPSHQFKELAGDLFCHGQSKEVDEMLRGEMAPKVKDCFISKTDIVFNPKSLNTEQLVLKQNGCHTDSCIVQCKRCLYVIGRARVQTSSGSTSNSDTKEDVSIQKVKENLSLHQTTTISLEWANITFETKGHEPVGHFKQPGFTKCESGEFKLAEELKSLSSEVGMYRFLLKPAKRLCDKEEGVAGKEGGVTMACIWYMSSEVTISTSKDGSQYGRISQYTGKIAQHFDDSSPNTSSVVCHAIKVLYKVCLESANQITAESWEADGSVCDWLLPEEECLKLLIFLTQSTQSLPPILRKANTFNVGYLKCRDL